MEWREKWEEETSTEENLRVMKNDGIERAGKIM